jgi:hypothetical protein
MRGSSMPTPGRASGRWSQRRRACIVRTGVSGSQGCAQPGGNPLPAVTSLQCHAQPRPCPCLLCVSGSSRPLSSVLKVAD